MKCQFSLCSYQRVDDFFMTLYIQSFHDKNEAPNVAGSFYLKVKILLLEGSFAQSERSSF